MEKQQKDERAKEEVNCWAHLSPPLGLPEISRKGVRVWMVRGEGKLPLIRCPWGAVVGD